MVTGYNDPQGRQGLFTSETVINCLVNHINRAFARHHSTYSYLFSAPPALHGQELNYVFYNNEPADVYSRPVNVSLAHTVQDYWLNFARDGDPNGPGLPVWGRWGAERRVQGISLAGVGPRVDVSENERCRWWQLGLYL